MSQKLKLHQKIAAVFLLLLSFTVLSILTFPVFASDGNGGGQVDPVVSHVTIDGNNIYYPADFNRDTAKFENNTLTLDGYNGGPIEISSENDVTINLKNTNTINTNEQNGIYSRANLIIDGDGSLTINSTDINGARAIDLSYGNDFTMNGGELNINLEGSGYDKEGINVGELTTINGGKINIHCDNTYRQGGGIISSYLLVNDGEVNSADIGVDAGAVLLKGGSVNSSRMTADIFIQNGGKFNIITSEDVALYSAKIIFNGGIAILEGTSAAIFIEYEITSEDIEEGLVEIEEVFNITIPRKTGVVEFNGGDVTLKGGVTAFQVADYSNDRPSEEDSTDWAVNIAEDMIVEPSGAKLNKYVWEEDKEDDRIYAVGFSDGTGDIVVIQIDEDPGFMYEHALKTVHIYKLSVPATDDEENPNTVDTKIIALAFGTLFAIIAEGAIIADLYRRLFGYKKAISNINASETEPEPTPETPSDPEIPAPQA